MPYITGKAPSQICAIGWEKKAHELETELTAIMRSLFTEEQLGNPNRHCDPCATIRALKVYAKLDGISTISKDVAEWAEKTFPNQTPKSKAEHLVDEAKELAEKPGDMEEMADVFLLLVHIAYMQGVNLLEAARKKLEINRKRQWGPADERGVHKHVSP
jgi:hypothetical protein